MLGLDRIRLFRALENAARSGYPLASALRTHAATAADADLSAAAAEIEGGSTVADALRRRPERFPVWQAELVAAGEAGGSLDRSFGLAAEGLERTREFWLGLLPKLAYPLLLIHFAPFAVHAGCLMNEGVWSFAGRVLGTLAPIYALGAVGWRLLRSVERRPALLVDLPLLGTMLRGRFAQHLALFARAGVPFAQALPLSAKAAGLPESHPGLEAAVALSLTGASAHEALAATGLFERAELDALKTGEATGHLDRELDYLAQIRRARMEAAAATALQVLPAALFIVIALLIARQIVGFYASRLDPAALGVY